MILNNVSHYSITKYLDDSQDLNDFIVFNIHNSLLKKILEEFKISDYMNHYIKLTNDFTTDFILDSSLITSKPHKLHAICAISCNNKPYIYNGYLDKSREYKACYFTPFDWKTQLFTTAETCFIIRPSDNCSLEFTTNTSDLTDDCCFSFNKDNLILLIYISPKYYQSIHSISSISSSVNIDKYISDTVVKDFYYTLDNVTFKNLKDLLNYIYISNNFDKLFILFIFIEKSINLYNISVIDLIRHLNIIKTDEITLSSVLLNNIYLLLSNNPHIPHDISITLLKTLVSTNSYLNKYILIKLIIYIYKSIYKLDINEVYDIIKKFINDNIKKSNHHELSDLFENIIYLYYQPDIRENENLFYGLYYYILINKNYLITSSNIDIYDLSNLDKYSIVEEANILKLSIRKVYKIIIQYHQVIKIFDFINELTFKYNPLFYIFLFSLYYHMNKKELNHYLSFKYHENTPVFNFNPRFDISSHNLVCLYKIGDTNEFILRPELKTTDEQYTLYGIFLQDSKY
jgi:hypothetical protein